MMGETIVYCPECGEQCQTLYFNSQRVIVGCDQCLERVSAQAYAEDFLDDIDPEVDVLCRLDEHGAFFAEVLAS